MNHIYWLEIQIFNNVSNIQIFNILALFFGALGRRKNIRNARNVYDNFSQRFFVSSIRTALYDMTYESYIIRVIFQMESLCNLHQFNVWWMCFVSQQQKQKQTSYEFLVHSFDTIDIKIKSSKKFYRFSETCVEFSMEPQWICLNTARLKLKRKRATKNKFRECFSKKLT